MTAAGPGAVRMPAEWERHAATWLGYPHSASDWPGKLSAVRWAFVEFVRKLQESEAVRLLVRSGREAGRARSQLRRGGADPDQIDIHVLATDRSWLRDSGPTFVQATGRLRAVCWRFDAWGRYSDWQADAAVGRFIADACGAPVVEPRIGNARVAMEGGAIDCNGAGSLLTTERCLLSRNRHGRDTGLSRKAWAACFRETLGATNVLWLGGGLAGDDTDGHVDTVARFTGPSTVAAAAERDSRDDNFAPLQDNLRRLRAMRDERGRPLDIAELPMPRPRTFNGWRLPLSYANFYIANRCVLVPTFNDPNDGAALRILGECFPDREVCGIHSGDLAIGLGALHCLSQQQPCAPG